MKISKRDFESVLLYMLKITLDCVKENFMWKNYRAIHQTNCQELLVLLNCNEYESSFILLFEYFPFKDLIRKFKL